MANTASDVYTALCTAFVRLLDGDEVDPKVLDAAERFVRNQDVSTPKENPEADAHPAVMKMAEYKARREAAEG